MTQTFQVSAQGVQGSGTQAVSGVQGSVAQAVKSGVRVQKGAKAQICSANAWQIHSENACEFLSSKHSESGVRVQKTAQAFQSKVQIQSSERFINSSKALNAGLHTHTHTHTHTSARGLIQAN